MHFRGGTEKIYCFEGSQAVAARPSVRSHFIANLKKSDVSLTLCAKFEIKNTVFWDVVPCRYFVNRRFGGTYRLHLQGRSNPRACILTVTQSTAICPRWFIARRLLLPRIWRRYVPPKRRLTKYLHGATSQNTIFFIVIAVKTSNLTSLK
jgi:hypothetical protein